MTMTVFIPRQRPWREAARAAVIALMFAFPVSSLAGPGAHGPGGEHLDAAAAPGSTGNARPRVESKSELFELVAHLGEGELSTLINRFETNEPVLNASVEVATGALKATARFHADHGDYSVDDAAFLKALSAPGEHPLIFTIIAGRDSDLLNGTLTVSPTQVHDHASEHGHLLEYSAIAAGALVAVAVVFGLWRRRSRSRAADAAAGSVS